VNKKIIVLACCASLGLAAGNIRPAGPADGPYPEAVAIDTASFNTVVDGKQVGIYTLKNRSGLKAMITNFGGRIVSLEVPDKTGKLTDVVLGYQQLSGYQKRGEPFFGALIGRYGNRIAKGRFTLDGKTYQLTLNNGQNTLHGGPTGFHNRVWDARQTAQNTLELAYLSKDMEEGFPGNLSVKVVYTLTNNNELKIEYSAATDKATVLNLTNHSYFNLNGEATGAITDHILEINAGRFTPADASLIPTGELLAVAGTPFDFRKPRAIGSGIDDADPQVKMSGGYDHNFVLDKKGKGLQQAATVTGPVTGIVMTVSTTEPALQFYSGNGISGRIKDGKGGAGYSRRSGFTMETQHFPDSPNQPSFPSTVLRPGKKYNSVTIYKFSVQKPG
jgi:aldose 1-epimerase